MPDAELLPLAPRGDDEIGNLSRGFNAFLDGLNVRRQSDAKLQLAASVFSHAREGIVITDADGHIIEVNDAFTRITGYPRNEVLGRNPRILSSGRHDRAFYDEMWRDLRTRGYWEGEVWNMRKSGQEYAQSLAIAAVRGSDQQTSHYVALFSDITRQKDNEQQLRHIAHFDPLTGLPNRVLLADRLEQAIVRVRRSGLPLALAYIDLDGFKSVNDVHGHDVGDQLLVTLAARMKDCLREGDTVARLGGDEFVAVLADLSNQSAAKDLIDRLLSVIAQPVKVDGVVVQVSGSIGISHYPQSDDVDPDQLLRQADQAMYQAKVAGKNRYHIFDTARDASLRGQHEHLERIREGLIKNEFVLHYQPKVNMRSG
ncbi:MAG: diguanylate cyclase, partial [Rhodocyclaceae bacterium]|nr:diguanylate cyclase [Rhodocyclaceae bacterium]